MPSDHTLKDVLFVGVNCAIMYIIVYDDSDIPSCSNAVRPIHFGLLVVHYSTLQGGAPPVMFVGLLTLSTIISISTIAIINLLN